MRNTRVAFIQIKDDGKQRSKGHNEVDCSIRKASKIIMQSEKSSCFTHRCLPNISFFNGGS